MRARTTRTPSPRRRTPRRAQRVDRPDARARRSPAASIRPAPASGRRRTPAAPRQHWLISFEEFKKGARALHPRLRGRASPRAIPTSRSRRSRRSSVRLADQYADPNRKVVSLLDDGLQPAHPRHLGERAGLHGAPAHRASRRSPATAPSRSPASPRPAAPPARWAPSPTGCPADMMVDNAEHRAHAEELWKLPAKTINPKVGSHITQMMRDLEDGKLRWLWVQVTNPFQSTANANHWIEAARELDSFIVVSDVYPTLSAKVRRPHPAVGDDLREVGRLRQLGAAHAAVAQQVVCRPARRAATSGRCWSSPSASRSPRSGARSRSPASRPTASRRGRSADVLAGGRRRSATRPTTTLYDVLFATPANRGVRLARPGGRRQAQRTVDARRASTGSRRRRCSRSTPRFGRGHGHDLAPFDVYFRDDVRGLRWPVVNGKETPWRFNEEYDPYAAKGSRHRLLRQGRARSSPRATSTAPKPGEPVGDRRQGQDLLPPLRRRRRRRPTRPTTSGSPPAGCSSTGTPAR